MEGGDIAWMLISTALVLFMVPGLALFYGGMVRSKNVLNMLNMNTYCLGIVPLLWVLVTFSLGNTGSGEGIGNFIGNFDNAGLKDLRGTDLIGVAFSMTFAAITPALIAGAVADRMKFSAWAIFVPLWSILVYTPVFYWVYYGWHHDLSPGAIDFAAGSEGAEAGIIGHYHGTTGKVDPGPAFDWDRIEPLLARMLERPEDERELPPAKYYRCRGESVALDPE